MNHTIIHLTDTNFKKKVLTISNAPKNNPFLIDFWAEWCKPCQAMLPILENIAKKFCDVLQVAKLNIDENPITTKQYNIRSVPTLLLMCHGAVLSTKIGLLSQKELEEFLQQYIS
ncbi:thioredoxin [Candidatus Blochmannia ocreatus (nom. nud.)]|uniref:Thioredoxin n=1 Tax=Candidatus Blochmannia ocreatus (nom. nud.) TaxID=251538 RepID=A0ABY4SUA5_9ENTR|nr:thioredoxin [Candidatus Blochmannia ocreatus]URJ25058.1 thioredoxin [Candidatus Blochmannia ocreatus]